MYAGDRRGGDGSARKEIKRRKGALEKVLC